MRKLPKSPVFLVGLVGGLTLSTLSAHATVLDYVNLSTYANNNIYTDLNENFPNTGAGTPGMGTGATNASFLFAPWTYTPPAAAASSTVTVIGTPSAPLGNNGISFQLNSNSSGQDFVQIGTAAQTGQPAAFTGPNPLTVTIGATDVTTVYALMAAYSVGGQTFNVTFDGAGGEMQTFNGVRVQDFNGGTINTCVAVAGVCQNTVYQVDDQGGGGTGDSTTGDTTTYDLTEVAFTLDSALSSDTLTSATFTSNGYETLLLGLTAAETPSTNPVPEPGSLMLLGSAIFGFGLVRSKRQNR